MGVIGASLTAAPADATRFGPGAVRGAGFG